MVLSDNLCFFLRSISTPVVASYSVQRKASGGHPSLPRLTHRLPGCPYTPSRIVFCGRFSDALPHELFKGLRQRVK